MAPVAVDQPGLRSRSRSKPETENQTGVGVGATSDTKSGGQDDLTSDWLGSGDSGQRSAIGRDRRMCRKELLTSLTGIHGCIAEVVSSSKVEQLSVTAGAVDSVRHWNGVIGEVSGKWQCWRNPI